MNSNFVRVNSSFDSMNPTTVILNLFQELVLNNPKPRYWNKFSMTGMETEINSVWTQTPSAWTQTPSAWTQPPSSWTCFRISSLTTQIPDTEMNSAWREWKLKQVQCEPKLHQLNPNPISMNPNAVILNSFQDLVPNNPKPRYWNKFSMTGMDTETSSAWREWILKQV
jgi:hypothetical protein